MKSLKYEKFSNIDISDDFFSSLKSDYAEFEEWFLKKAKGDAEAYVFFNSRNRLDGFLYLKREDQPDDKISPPLPSGLCVKVGTLKINAHGTKLGERFLKKAFDHAMIELSLIHI